MCVCVYYIRLDGLKNMLIPPKLCVFQCNLLIITFQFMWLNVTEATFWFQEELTHYELPKIADIFAESILICVLLNENFTRVLY